VAAAENSQILNLSSLVEVELIGCCHTHRVPHTKFGLVERGLSQSLQLACLVITVY
jgi:hypothetical protein